MLILIAESKTMTPCDTPVDRERYAAHTPVFIDRAAGIMGALTRMPADELAARTRLSAAMVSRLMLMARGFPDTGTGARAAEAFTGVVFKAFGYDTLDAEARARTQEHLAIVSSLYGWLRPADIVKPYRLDYTTPAAPDGTALAAWWRRAVTARLLDTIAAGAHETVIDMLPADAARCIDWKAVKEHARVFKVDFREMGPGGATRTPHAGRLKTLRGLMLRHVMTNAIDTPEELAAAETDECLPTPQGAPGNITFLTAAPEK